MISTDNTVVATGGGGSSYFVTNQMLPNSLVYPTNTSLRMDSHPLNQIHTALPPPTSGPISGSSDRNRSPSSTRSVSSMDHAQRRATHNAIERARRESLNSQFQDLASAVPALIHVRRPSKAIIVEKSLEYIRSFKDHLGNRDQYIKKLQLRNLALHDEVNRLRKQLGMEPLSEQPEVTELVKPQVSGTPSPTKSSDNKPTRSLVAEHRAQQLLHKRRQQSLDLGLFATGSPALRVQTASNASRIAGSLGSADEGSGSGSTSPLQLSPLSAPILTQAPQLPMTSASVAPGQGSSMLMSPTSASSSMLVDNATVLAFGTLVMPSQVAGVMPFGLPNALPVGAMEYLAQQQGVMNIDLSKLGDVFVTSVVSGSGTQIAAAPAHSDTSDSPLASSLQRPQPPSSSSQQQHFGAGGPNVSQ
ncbi:hypothetical protein GGI07_003930 [Coemansia sp. Benny D115]|nr:hypothetical protein GGI07_003930 [Coemansia sp. Benny D115]